MVGGTRERSRVSAGLHDASKFGWRSEVSATNSGAESSVSVFAVSGKKVLVGGNMKDPQRLLAGVEYLEMETIEDESPPPRSVDASATWQDSVMLLSVWWKPGGGAKTAV